MTVFIMKAKVPLNPITGWINLYKPFGMSSTAAVNKVKWLLRPQKIGHAGTLDPLATGVLPLALGKATKSIHLLMDAKKTYEFSVTFGQRRTTDDAEGEVIATSDVMPTPSDIQTILQRFTGEIEQIPPIFSALKINGKRAYDLARAGEVPEMKARRVTVYELEFLGVGEAGSANSPLAGEWQPASPSPLIAHFRAVVSKGTYIRSLGRDIAQALGTEGYISRLHRAAVGAFCDAQAISLDFLEKYAHNPALAGQEPVILPLAAVLDDIPAGR